MYVCACVVFLQSKSFDKWILVGTLVESCGQVGTRLENDFENVCCWMSEDVCDCGRVPCAWCWVWLDMFLFVRHCSTCSGVPSFLCNVRRIGESNVWPSYAQRCSSAYDIIRSPWWYLDVWSLTSLVDHLRLSSIVYWLTATLTLVCAMVIYAQYLCQSCWSGVVTADPEYRGDLLSGSGLRLLRLVFWLTTKGASCIVCMWSSPHSVCTVVYFRSINAEWICEITIRQSDQTRCEIFI